MAEFRRDHRVRFAEVDYAGIVFYPRYFEALHATVEDWFADRLEMPVDVLRDAYGVTTPLVGMKTDFLMPCRLGERLVSSLRVDKIGTASVTLDVATTGADGTLRMRSFPTHVCVKLDVSGAVPWPAEVAARMIAFQNED